MCANGAAIALAEFATQFGDGDCSPGDTINGLGRPPQLNPAGESRSDHRPSGRPDEVLAAPQIEPAAILEPGEYPRQPSVALTPAAAEHEDVGEACPSLAAYSRM